MESETANNVIQNIKEYIKLPWDDVVINNHKAEKYDDGDFKFGCADISREQLIKARAFLDPSNNPLSKSPTETRTRKFECVFIGAGKFTIPILDKLLESTPNEQ